MKTVETEIEELRESLSREIAVSGIDQATIVKIVRDTAAAIVRGK